MGNVAVVTDSSASLPTALTEEFGIHVVPNQITFRRQSFRDGLDITPSDVYRRLRASRDMPTTSAPSAGDFVRVYASLSQTAAGIVSIHVPSRFSATYDTAVLASSLVDNVPIRVIECGSVAMGQGFAVLEAARAAGAGAGLDEVVARAKGVAAKAAVFAMLATLKYLHRGGRIGGAATLLGSILRIKPILHLANGGVEVLAKARTQRGGIQLMLRQMAASVDGHPIHVAVLHADAPEEAEALKQRVAEEFDCAELLVTEFTPVMGAHTGPGLLGLAFYAE
jgi:DegV family protein with EDD domain